MKRLSTRLGLALLLSLFVSSPAWSTQEEVYDKGTALIKQLSDKKLKLTVDRKMSHLGELRAGDTWTQQIQIEQGYRYVLSALGDSDTEEIEITLYGMRGSKLASASGKSSAQIDTGVIRDTQPAYISIRLRKAKTESAHYGFVAALQQVEKD